MKDQVELLELIIKTSGDVFHMVDKFDSLYVKRSLNYVYNKDSFPLDYMEKLNVKKKKMNDFKEAFTEIVKEFSI